MSKSLDDLKKASVLGGLFTIGARLCSVGIQISSTVILARLLEPEAFGLIAMVLVITQFAGLFKDMGLSSAAIQTKTLNEQQQSNLFWVNAGLGLFLTVLVSSLAPAVAWFYDSPELMAVTVVMSFKFFISSLGSQHDARLLREMRYVVRTIAEVSGALAGLAVSVLLALRGLSLWALVWGNLTLVSVHSVILLCWGWFPLKSPRARSGSKPLLKFGANVTGFEFVNYFHRNLDNLLIGRVWGADALGFYSRAYTLLMLPITSIRVPLQAVAFPALSRLQNEPDAYRVYFQRVLFILGLFTIPLASFAWLAAEPLIIFVLGANWSEVVPIFAILAVASIIQPVTGLRGVVLLSLGLGRKFLHWGILNAVLTSLAFLIGIRWGATGVARAYTIAIYLILQPSLHYVFHKTPLRPSDFWIGIWRPLASSMGALMIVTLAKFFVPINGGPLTNLFFLAFFYFGFFGVLYTTLPGGFRSVKWIYSLILSTLRRK